MCLVYFSLPTRDASVKARPGHIARIRIIGNSEGRPWRLFLSDLCDMILIGVSRVELARLGRLYRPLASDFVCGAGDL